MVSSHADLIVPARAGATGVGHSKGSHQLRFEERAERLPWAFQSSLSLRLWADSRKSICQGARSGAPSLHAPTLADSKARLQPRYHWCTIGLGEIGLRGAAIDDVRAPS